MNSFFWRVTAGVPEQGVPPAKDPGGATEDDGQQLNMLNPHSGGHD